MEMSAMVGEQLKRYKLGSLEHWRLLETSKATSDRVIEVANSLRKLGDVKDDESPELSIEKVIELYKLTMKEKKSITFKQK